MYGHWVERLAEKIRKEKSPPFIVNSGITTSGPTHLGTLCEFLYPFALYSFLKKEDPRTKFYFVADLLDAFDSIPSSLMNFSTYLTPHLGKPLSNTPDPLNCHPSLGEHFLSDVLSVMANFGVEAEILRATDLYAEGRYDKYARLFLKNKEEVEKIVAETSLKPYPIEGWSPIMPICAHCGKIATTTLTSYNQKTDTYTYVCNKDVKYTKGCGFSGKNKISDHKYKLIWRLDWPSRQHFLHASVEGAGVDHMTRGGSWDTAKAIHEKFLGGTPPIPYKFGFLLFKGKKYSKSKGEGMSVSELLQILPPETIKYLLLRPDLEENIDINPTPENLLKLLDDFSLASRLAQRIKEPSLSRAERKKAAAFLLSTDKIKWHANFRDLLLLFQIYKDWEIVSQKSHDPEGTAYLKKYIENWISKNLVPEDYRFAFTQKKTKDESARFFFSKLKPGMGAEEIHNLVFETASSLSLEPKELFRRIYLALIGKEKGPRLGKLIEALGVEKVRQALL